MRIEYQYKVDLRDYKNIELGQMASFNGFCKTKDDCIEAGKKIISEHPEVIEVYFKRVDVFPRLGITVFFRKKSLVFDNFGDYQQLRECNHNYRVIWDSRSSR